MKGLESIISSTGKCDEMENLVSWAQRSKRILVSVLTRVLKKNKTNRMNKFYKVFFIRLACTIWAV